MTKVLVSYSLGEMMSFSEQISKSTMIPKDYQGQPANVLVAVQWGHEVGLGPLQALQNIAVINGRPSIWGDAALALVRASGLLEYIDESFENGAAICRIKRKGPNEKEQIRKFGPEEAKRANLLGKQGPWSQYPERMMQMRARGFALRDVFPDVLKGIYIAEEAQDIPAENVQAEVQRPLALPPGSSLLQSDPDARRDVIHRAKELNWGEKRLTAFLNEHSLALDTLTRSDADNVLAVLAEEKPRARTLSAAETADIVAEAQAAGV